jgi:hypothetical protein
MSNDFIDELFSTVDEYYPGSKRKRKETKKEARVPEVKTWDARPFVKTLPNGKDVEMFTLGALAEALGRPVATVRAWTVVGYLPPPPYRLPDVVDVKGVTRKGRRLYSRAMVIAAVEIFAKFGLLDSIRIEWSELQEVPRELAETWNTIRVTENEIIEKE